tara:strand:- start:71 stop:322 length:252 start_codon:yes stop_codon:yes gene_type:complete
MSTESLRKTSKFVETPTQMSEVINVEDIDVLKQESKTHQTKKKVNIEILKQRLLQEKKKERVKRTIILSSVIVSLGALTMLTY